MDLIDEFLQRAKGDAYTPRKAVDWLAEQEGVGEEILAHAEVYLKFRNEESFRAAVVPLLAGGHTAGGSPSFPQQDSSLENYLEKIWHELSLPNSLQQSSLLDYIRTLSEDVGILKEHRLPTDGRSRKEPPRLGKVYVKRRGRLTKYPPRGRQGAKAGKDEFEIGRFPTKEGIFTSLLEENRCAVIVAGPGMGKTFYLRRLCLWMSEDDQDREFSIPVLITLRHFVTWFETRVEKGATPARLRQLFWEYLADEWKDFPKLAEGIKEWVSSPVEEGRSKVTFLFDGLDEVPIERELRQQTSRMIEALASIHQGGRFFVTSRVRSYSEDSDWALVEGNTPWPVCEIVDFSPEESILLVKAWFREITEQGWVSPEKAGDLREELLSALEKDKALTKIRKSPLMLTMMCIIQSKEHRMPKGRGDLYDQLTLLLIGEWEDRRADGKENKFSELCTRYQDLTGADDPLTAGDIRLALAKLVLVLMKDPIPFGEADTEEYSGGFHQELGILIPEDKVRRVFQDLCPARQSCPDLDGRITVWVTEMMSLLQDHGTLLDRYKAAESPFVFPHRQYGEFLAGWYAVKHLCQGNPQGLRDLCQTREEWEEKWREPILFGVSFLWANKSEEVSTMKSLIGDLVHQPATHLALQMAGEMLAEFGTNIDLSLHREDVVSRLKESAFASESKDAESLQDRIYLGLTLGVLGDDRKGVGLKDQLPDFDWSGPLLPDSKGFRMGSNRGDWGAYDDEYDGFLCTDITIPFEMARFPVTVAQFERFVEAGGYEPAKKNRKNSWWCEKGWTWKESDSISSPDYQSYGREWQVPTAPVTGISWYEASAFCRWYSEVGDREIFLPTEAQWEFAARGNGGRIFPWGDDREGLADRCNYGNLARSVSPVGLFGEKGEAVESKTADQSGNVWEWTSSNWTSGYRDREKVEQEYFSIRGGSFFNLTEDVRCAVRLRSYPELRNFYRGFRVLSSPLGNPPET